MKRWWWFLAKRYFSPWRGTGPPSCVTRPILCPGGSFRLTRLFVDSFFRTFTRSDPGPQAGKTTEYHHASRGSLYAKGFEGSWIPCGPGSRSATRAIAGPKRSNPDLVNIILTETWKYRRVIPYYLNQGRQALIESRTQHADKHSILVDEHQTPGGVRSH